MNLPKVLMLTALFTSLLNVMEARVYQAGSWQDPWLRGNLETYDPSPSHTKAGFVKGHIGNPQLGDILLYSFYVITDPHVGDYETPSSCEDYNLPGYSAGLDTSNWKTRNLNMGDGFGGAPNGGTIGNYLNWAVQLINSHYDYGNGCGGFCVVLGDESSRGERAELQHAKIKLDSLDCPWVPVRGNHDTWPWVKTTGAWTKDDRYFEYVFESYFANHAAKAFPCWYKAAIPTVPPEEPHLCNWGFNWGASRHLGLDVLKRCKGGDWTILDYLFDVNAEMFQGITNGTFDFTNSQMSQWHNSTSNVMMYAHAPLSWTSKLLYGNGDFFPFPQFTAAERTDILEQENTYYPARTNYWFSGHAHNGSGNAYPDEALLWDVGLEAASMTTRVFFFPGIYGSEAGDGPWGDKQYYVGLVEVYGEHKCDFSYTSSSPNPPFIDLGVPIQFVDECVSSDGYQMPSSYYWTFGDGAASSASNPTKHYHNVGKYYVQLKATFTSGATYTSKPLLIGFNYPQICRVRFWPYTSSSSMNSPLFFGSNVWKAEVCWWDQPHKAWFFANKYEVWRKRQYDPQYTKVAEKTTRSVKFVSSAMDNGPFFSNQWVHFRVLGQWRKHNYPELGQNNPFPPEDFWGRDTVVQAPEPPPPPPSCPEAYSFVGYDSTSGGFEFAPNNTVLPHSLCRPQMAKDLLRLDWLPVAYQGFTAVTFIERNTEISVFDEIKLHAIDHPQGTEIATSADGNIYCCQGFLQPWACYDAMENDYLNNVLLHPGDSLSLHAVAGQEIFVKFDFPCWGENSGLILSSGWEKQENNNQKNIMISAYQEDTSGNWNPIGFAYTRNTASEWLMKTVEDTGAAMLPSFKLQFSGEDTACINYICLVSLVDSGWTDTTIPPTMAMRWYQVGGVGGEWQSENKTVELLSIDDSLCTLAPNEQLVVVFPEITPNPDTLMVRDYVLESYGVYTSQPQPSPAVMEKESIFTYDLKVQQVHPFSRTAILLYQVPHQTNVTLKLYDASGRLVKTFVEDKLSAGKYSIPWDGTDERGVRIGSGIYFARIVAGDFTKTVKLVIVE